MNDSPTTAVAAPGGRLMRLRVVALAAVVVTTIAFPAAQQGVVLTGVPTGVSSDANPEIHVSAPGAVAFKYSLNGAPYSDELPIDAPIRLSGTVRFGSRSFTAGTGDLSTFINLRSTDDSFTEFLDGVAVSDVTSQLQITYLLNRIRSAVAAENVLNVWGTGVGALQVALRDKTPSGPHYELSAIAVTGGRLAKIDSADSTRRFRVRLPAGADSLTLTPAADNPHTAVTVNGAPLAAGASVTLPYPAAGSTIALQASAPGAVPVNYSIEVAYDASLEATVYRSFYLRAFNPAASYVSVRNGGAVTVAHGLTLNDRLGVTKQGLLREIEDMATEFPGEPMARKVWRFVKKNRYHFDPLTGSTWFSSATLFMNSAGFGYCDDSAALFLELMRAFGFAARTWGLNGHVVSEALVGGRWEMWDPDLEVYYFTRDGQVAGVAELVADPTLVTAPTNPVLPVGAWPYHPDVAAIYSTQSDNFVHPEEVVADRALTVQIPAGATLEFPDVYDGPLVTRFGTSVPSYANARLTVPAGFAGTLAPGLIVQSIGWSSAPRLSVITRNASGVWDSQPTEASWIVDAVAPITTASQPSGHYNADEAVTLVASEPATIHYTTDGSHPTDVSPVYAGPIPMPPGGIVKFFAIDAAGNHGATRGYGPPVAAVSLLISSIDPATAVFAASASGGTGIYEYKYLLRDTHGTWTTVQRYGPDAGLSWDRSDAPAGSYLLVVWARNPGSTAEFEAQAWVTFALTVNHAPDLANPGDQVNADSSRTYAETVLADAPLAYLRLGDSGTAAADATGVNDGLAVGGVTTGQPGALADGDTAMRFNGSTGYVGLANPAASLEGDLTLELWLNVTLGGRQTLASKEYNREFELTLEPGGNLNFYQGNGLAYEETPTGFPLIASNGWHHLVVTRTAATKTIRFYVNGVERKTATYLAVPAAGTRGISIGRSNSGNRYVNGLLDEVAIFPAALTSAEVASHYALRSYDGGGLPIALQLVATDPDGDGLTYSVTGLPAGLTVNPTTGLVSGTLSPASAGVHQVSASASDGTLSATRTFTWTVTHLNRAPSLAQPANQTTAEGAGVSLALAGSDPDNDPLTYSVTGLPASLTVDAATGLVSGALSFASAGSYAVTATVSDGFIAASRSFTWTVTNTNRAPVLTNPGDRTDWDIAGYPQRVLSDGPAGYWRFGETTGATAADLTGANAAALAGGFTLGQAGALADGNAAVLLNGSTGYARAANPAASLAGDLTIELWLNVGLGATRQTLVSKGYQNEFELTLEPSGHLNFYQGNGTGYQETPSTFVLIAANTWQHLVVTRTAATKTVRFYVNGVERRSATYTTTVAASGRPVSVGRSDAGSKYVNGRLDDVAIYGSALSAAQVAAHYALRTANGPGTVVSLQLAATDPDGDGLTYSATGLPPGLTVNATGLVSGTLAPASVGSWSVTVTASDGVASQSQSFTWVIKHATE